MKTPRILVKAAPGLPSARLRFWGRRRHVHGHAPVQEHRAAEDAGSGSGRGRYLADPDPTAGLRGGKTPGMCVIRCCSKASA